MHESVMLSFVCVFEGVPYLTETDSSPKRVDLKADANADSDGEGEGKASLLCFSKKSRTMLWHRMLLLVIAITVHNIPEGLAVGVAFGAVGHSESATFNSAKSLAIGIGIQNFPEGFSLNIFLVIVL